MSFLNVNLIFEISCFIIAAFYSKKEKNITWKSFKHFLFLTCVIEISGLIISKVTPKSSNYWLYNIFLIIEVVFNSAMFSLFINKYINSKHYVILGLTIFSLVFLFETVYHGIFIFNNITSTISSILFVVYSLYYFYLLIKDPNYYSLKSYTPFWWVTGTLFFYFGSTISNLFFEELLSLKVSGHHLRYYIFNLLNIILYSCWSYSFICRYYQTK